MAKTKKQIIIRDLTIFALIMYFVLLILNVFLQSFVEALFPLWLWGWGTVGLIGLYVLVGTRLGVLLLDKKPKK